MPKIQYKQFRFSDATLATITQAEKIIIDYERQGFSLTLRQLYYQFVSRDLIANNQKEYKRLGDIVNNARLAGLIDWHSIEDRTRNLQRVTTWNHPSDILDAVAAQFKMDPWENQERHVEVWIEKDALVGVIEGECRKARVPWFSCRGYPSQSEVWGAAMRLENTRKPCTILHLGDHDPSGIDMTRDLQDRLNMFTVDVDVTVERIALNRDQVDQYNPPPNFAKATDARFGDYQRVHGTDCWELDALSPKVIADLVGTQISYLCDTDLFQDCIDAEEDHRKSLKYISRNYETIIQNKQ